MKIIILLLFSIPFLLHAQNTYTFSYDEAGNRSERCITIPRSPSLEEQKYKDSILSHSITIYPNPTPGKLTVEITNLNKGLMANIEIFDMKGKLLINLPKVSEFSNTVNLEDYPAAVYMMRISIGGKTTTWKILKN